LRWWAIEDEKSSAFRDLYDKTKKIEAESKLAELEKTISEVEKFFHPNSTQRFTNAAEEMEMLCENSDFAYY
jgi:hypothetical protein